MRRAKSVHSTRDTEEIVRMGRDDINALEGRRNDAVRNVWVNLANTWNGATRKWSGTGKMEVLKINLERTDSRGLEEVRVIFRDERGSTVAADVVSY
jgi:hypothetical protein